MSSSCYSKIRVGDVLSLVFTEEGYVRPKHSEGRASDVIKDCEVIDIIDGDPLIMWRNKPTPITEYLIRKIKKNPYRHQQPESKAGLYCVSCGSIYDYIKYLTTLQRCSGCL